MSLPVLPLCCCRKVLDFMINNTRLQTIDQFSEVIQCKLAVKAKGKLTQNENGQKIHCNVNKDIAQFTAKQRQRKREIAAMFVFVCIGQ